MANRYWVGGSGTWNTTSTTNWSTTSGGSGGASAPTTADAVIIDASSGAGTITLGENVLCLTLNMSAYAGTLNFATYKISASGTNTTVFTGGTSCTITGTPLIDLISTGTTGTRTIASGVVTESNSISFNVSAGAGNLSITGTNAIRSLDLTGYSGAIANTAFTMYGNLIVGATTSFAASTSAITFAATSGTKTITTNGVSIDKPFTFSGIGGTFQLQDNCTIGSTRGVTLTNGTLDLNSKILSCGVFSSNNSNIRSILFGTGNITVTGSNTIIWQITTATNLTVIGEPTVNLTYSGSTGTRTVFAAFTAGGLSSNAFNFNITGGSDTVSFGKQAKSLNCTGFSGTLASSSIRIYKNLTLSPTMTTSLVSGATVFVFYPSFGEGTYTTNGATISGNTILGVGESGGYGKFVGSVTQTGSMSVSGTATYRFTAGSTYTFSTLLFTTTSTSRSTFLSTVPGTRYTFSSPSGTVTAQYMTIQDCAATGGATWNAARSLGNSNAGNNTGWVFSGTIPTTTQLSMRLGFGL